MVAFQAAYEVGARYIELDVHTSRDGEVVVSHDPHLERTCNNPGIILEMAYADILKADAGYGFVDDEGKRPFAGKGITIPRLSEVLGEFPELRFIVEIKQSVPSLIEALLKVLERTGMRRRVIVASEHQAPLTEIRARAPSIPTSFCSTEVGFFVQALPVKMAGYAAPGEALQIPPEYESFKLVTPESVAAAHQLGIEMHIWTVNDASEMKELLATGVDGIITDFPARLLKLLHQN